MKDVFKVEEAARICRTSIWTLHRRIKEGSLASFRAGGGRTMLILRTELVRFLEVNNIPIPEGLVQEDKRVLICDTQNSETLKLRRLLEENHFKVEVTYTGLTTGLAIREFLPQVLLLNGDLPTLDANELSRIIKRDQVMQSTPILAFIRSNAPGSLEKLKNTPADERLPYPIKPEQILQKLEQYVSPVPYFSNQAARRYG